jgi:Icc-related predicted phosphoesterase
MRIRVFSDLHLEFADFVPPPVEADLVVLAGDIHVGTKGIEWAETAFPDQPVVYVPGNHEYYDHAIPRLTTELRRRARRSNVRILERGESRVAGVTILGCTLWTSLELNGSSAAGAEAAVELMSDFSHIHASAKERLLHPLDTVEFHEASLIWLRRAAARAEGPVVVVTHHAPSSRSLRPGSDGTPEGAAYASPLEAMVSDLSPALWIHGHIHKKSDYRLGGTRVLCNPRGYPDEPCDGFDPGLVVTVRVPGSRRGTLRK